ncbi:hypothetical protein TREMEDRAFT_65562 [Tremella mesenterica DSM 1558]|uniref:uncharacterized protein n=1 Tax=Tremella mesenterica (strain ATCC 24925 / CBS 8224 / DSM 1558 / NBRC 9311 / NRRL Y-6157 / RJB 2259-6 / UBC 559-6) TaxID=578456 RepID=UPI00032BBFA3|nr:uncharacterized protein TREMEDRAFT_65562 [Tremella mesenterica DSM 1558]EIW66291.1 hypothetical protein TREMEDRAFT_65562 [Tremella mesenterica DSM 1558]
MTSMSLTTGLSLPSLPPGISLEIACLLVYPENTSFGNPSTELMNWDGFGPNWNKFTLLFFDDSRSGFDKLKVGFHDPNPVSSANNLLLTSPLESTSPESAFTQVESPVDGSILPHDTDLSAHLAEPVVVENWGPFLASDEYQSINADVVKVFEPIKEVELASDIKDVVLYKPSDDLEYPSTIEVETDLDDDTYEIASKDASDRSILHSDLFDTNNIITLDTMVTKIIENPLSSNQVSPTGNDVHNSRIEDLDDSVQWKVESSSRPVTSGSKTFPRSILKPRTGQESGPGYPTFNDDGTRKPGGRKTATLERLVRRYKK